jgi:phosphohistidine swiveling domain-containing protein
MTQLFTFKDSSFPTIEQVGGKGLSLIHLANEGFPVPIAAVLSTEFFQPWIERLEASPEWEAFAQTKADDVAAAATAVKKSAQALAFSEDQQQTLSRVRQHLKAEDITLVAVRSSSPEEDLEGASFAGIYETILGVTDDGLQAAIKTCFASALDERVVAYKQERGFDPLDPKIAVVIQEQIASGVSGVAFSLNPVNNCYDECVINANFGLGVTVVDGMITPDQFIVDRVTHVILGKTPGQKDVATYLKADGGTESKAPDSPSDFCLSDEQVLAVTSLTAKVEAEYGKPMDIEWAYEGEQLYLLQARPITTYYRLPDRMITPPGQQRNLYQDQLVTEQGLAEDMSPLGCDLYVKFMSEMMDWLGPDESFTTFERGLAFACAGRVYTHVGRMAKVIGKKNVVKTLRIADDLGCRIIEAMDLKAYLPKKLPKGFLKNFIKTGLGAVKYIKPLMKARGKPDEYLHYYQDENARLGAELKAEYERESSFGHFASTSLGKVNIHMNQTQLPALMVSERARGKLKKMFKKAPESVQEHFRNIEKSFPNNVTIEMGLVIHDLSQFTDVQQTATPEEFVQKLEANQLSPEFMEKWRLFAGVYGFRGPKEIDAATPRYYEKPGEVFVLLKSMGSQDDPDLTPRGIFERGARQRVESVQFLEDYLAGQSPGKVKAFRKSYKLLENFAAYRESPKYYIIMAMDYLRRRALTLGRKWVEAGRLDSVDQVFDLRLEEVIRAEVEAGLDVRTLATTNHAYYARFNPNNDPPVIIDSRGFIPKLPPKPHKENHLVGTPVSSGTVKGPVKVLRTPDEKPILPGDILVTKATDPGWTTLFINAAAVLLETGGTLQHGASVAREMGKPCIVGVEDVTKIIKDGQTVELDGATGIVRILGESTPNPA